MTAKTCSKQDELHSETSRSTQTKSQSHMDIDTRSDRHTNLRSIEAVTRNIFQGRRVLSPCLPSHSFALCSSLFLYVEVAAQIQHRLWSTAGERQLQPPDKFQIHQRISQLPKLWVKISILRHRRMWVRSFSTRLTSVTFAEDKVLIFLLLRKNAKIVQR